MPQPASTHPPCTTPCLPMHPTLTPSHAPSFEWCICDVGDPAEVQEVYDLLTLNYVEDDDAMFRWGVVCAQCVWVVWWV
jgi:hypothetical protein